MRHVRDALFVARNSDDKLISRPLSPHLQVYRWPLSMALSISHRVTGVGLAIGTLLMTWWLVAAAVSDDAFTGVQRFLATPIGILLLLGWSAALFFHFFTGLRHLAWDAGYGFELKTTYASGWTVVTAGFVLTVIAWVAAYMVRG